MAGLATAYGWHWGSYNPGELTVDGVEHWAPRLVPVNSPLDLN